MNNAVTAIEPGTTKMTVLVCRKGQNGCLELAGMGQAEYDGVQEDGWKSETLMYKALDTALGQARKTAGIKIDRCILGIPNEFCGLVGNTKEISLKRPVSRPDIIELRKLTSVYTLPAPWEISNVIYRNYIVDGRPVGNPLGLTCETLGLNASVICIHTDFAKQMTKVLNSLQVRVDKWIPVPLACGEALLTREERQKGAALIDTGGESTDIVVYKDGVPVFYDWIPLGGNDISRDISAGISVTADEAERLKRCCVLGLAVREEPGLPELQMPIRNGQHIQNISMDFLQQIVEARIEEILELAGNRIQAEGHLADCCRVVLTGGGLALFRGIREFGTRTLGHPVQLGVPDVIGLSSPALSAVYSVGHMELSSQPSGRQGVLDIVRALLKKLRYQF